MKNKIVLLASLIFLMTNKLYSHDNNVVHPDILTRYAVEKDTSIPAPPPEEMYKGLLISDTAHGGGMKYKVIQ